MSQIPHAHKKRSGWPALPDHAVWGDDACWILQYDNIMRHPGGKGRGCPCEIHRPNTPQSGGSTAGSLEDISLSSTRRTLSAKSTSSLVSRNAPAGAVDESSFRSAFVDVPSVPLHSAGALRDLMKSILTVVSNAEDDWEKRVDALKKLRSVLIADGDQYPEFPELLKRLEIPFMETLKDLRSQVVREACVTIAFLSERLKTKFNVFSEVVFQCLIALIQSSAKVMSTSSLTAVRFIIENTCSPRVLTMIVNNCSSKSKEIRRAMCDFLHQLLQTWPHSILDKKDREIVTALRKGIEDADPDARLLARKAFLVYKSNFPERADELLKSVDASYRRMLSDNSNNSSQYGSTSSLSTQHSRFANPLIRSDEKKKPPPVKRSNSAIDPQAVKRADVRAKYAAVNRLKARMADNTTSPSSIQPAVSVTAEKVVEARSRTRAPRYSRSQPTSRSASPSSHLSYHTYQSHNSRTLGRPSGIPLSATSSKETSRETSPTRYGVLAKARAKKGLFSSLDRSSLSNSTPKALQDSIDSDFMTLSFSEFDRSQGEKSSDESETASISERSTSYSGLRTPAVTNIQEIIQNLSKPSWNDRKDGLQALKLYLSKYDLSPDDVQKVTSIFNKMFMDSQTKVYTIFLDAVHTLILRHKRDLNFWLYVLFKMLFTKLGTDVLPTIESKIQCVLSSVTNNFSHRRIVSEIFRYIVDPRQTHSIKARIAVLQYLSNLAMSMESSDLLPDAGGKDSTSAVLSKLCKWMEIPEVKSSAQDCFIQLFLRNTSCITMKLATLSKEEQDVFNNLVHGVIRRQSNCSTSPPVLNNSHSQRQEEHNSDPSHADIYRSLRQTTAEIQRYSFERNDEHNSSSTNHDTGFNISLDNLTNLRIDGDAEDDSDSPSKVIKAENNDVAADANTAKAWSSTFALLLSEETPLDEKINAINYLENLIVHGQFDIVALNFKKIVKTLVNLLSCLDDHAASATKQEQEFLCGATRALHKLLLKPGIEPLCAEFTELLLMRVIKILENRDHSKLELCHTEECLREMAKKLPLVPTLKTLQTFAFSKVTGLAYQAIEGIQVLVESHTKEEFAPHLQSAMSNLLLAFNSDHSPVRKAVVFCIVGIHGVFGEEEMKPFLDKFNPSKRKLIDVYIQRRGQNRR